MAKYEVKGQSSSPVHCLQINSLLTQHKEDKSRPSTLPHTILDKQHNQHVWFHTIGFKSEKE